MEPKNSQIVDNTMPRKVAVATLLYSADYLPGVFTLGYQLQKFRGERDVELLLLVSRDLYQETLSELSVDVLSKLYSKILVVDPIEGFAENEENLKLLKRPELKFTLVKARLWGLEYDQVLYLDGDTLPLSPDVFNLFEDVEVQHSEIAGAPDVGWPDMFNSGVLLLAPDGEMAQHLRLFIKETASLDGADQGILNQFFNANCNRGIESIEQKWIRLPFIYNVTMPNYGYQSSPATKYFKQQIKLVHFIGENKPWRGWSGEENEYSSHWNKVFTEFQIEYGLSPYMEQLNVRASPSPWKESLEENRQEPERVFPTAREQGLKKKDMQQQSQRVFPTSSKEEVVLEGRQVLEQQPERVFPGSEEKEEDEESEKEEELLEELEHTDLAATAQRSLALRSHVKKKLDKSPWHVERVFPEDN